MKARKALSLFATLFVFFSLNLQAQKDTTQCKKGDKTCCLSSCLSDLEVNGFGGPIVTHTWMGLGNSTDIGGGGGVIFEDRFFIGGFGKGGQTWIENEKYGQINIESGYGGLWLGGYFCDEHIVRPKASVKLGIGGMGVEAENDTTGQFSGEVFENETIYVAEPEVGIGVKVTPYFMLDAGIGYRIFSGMSGSKELNISPNDMNGFQGTLSFKFGKF